VRTAKGEPQQYAPLGKDREAIRRRKSTANRVLANLVAALNLQWRDGKVTDNSAWKRVRPFRETSAARVRFLDVAEAGRLLNSCEPDFRDLVRAALETGCRLGELVRLRVGDFNPDASTLTVTASKGGRSRHVHLTDLGAQFFEQLCAGRAKSQIMLRRADGLPWGPSQQDARIKRACERANIEPAISFHILRHTWASLSVMAGVPLAVVARNLGHATTRMTEMHYAHLAPSYAAQQIRDLAPRFEAPTNKIASIGRRR
jgi:integrase